MIPTARALAYLLAGALTGPLVLLAGTLLAVTGTALSPVLVGLPLLAALALGGIPLAAVERWRLRWGTGIRVPDAHRVPARPGLGPWARTRFQEAATWREFGYAVLVAWVLWPLEALVVVFGVAVPLATVATPVLLAAWGETKVLKVWTVTSWPAAALAGLLGLVLLAAGLRGVRCAAAGRAALARLVLAPGPAESARVVELTRSRARLVDAFEVERRRIERDLHDGAQQRLVSLTMTLGLARLDAPGEGPLAEQLARAQAEASAALTELRELIQGIHPAVLTDYGLEAAISDAADRSPIPVRVSYDAPLPRRPLPPVESAAYFVVREALANAARHSGATRIEVTARHHGAGLLLAVRDDGRGGADPAGGSGLTGLADRVAVLDGTLRMSSPPGGPTVLTVEIPCRCG